MPEPDTCFHVKKPKGAGDVGTLFFLDYTAVPKPVCSITLAGTQVHDKIQTQLYENAHILNPKDRRDGGKN